MLFPATARGGPCISLLPSLKRAQEFEAGRGGVLRSSKRNEKRISRKNVKSQYVPEVPACAAVVHSSRSSIIGSTDSARCAGIHVASSPSKAITRTTPANTSGSRGVA
jgi:hypothetical protein